MAGNGPPPNPNARRRNVRVGLVRLPAKGRDGDVPEWPVGYDPSGKERAIWAELWSTPQAVAWEQLGYLRSVARYVTLDAAASRSLDNIDDPKLYAAMLANQTRLLPELRQLEDRLGLNPKAMRSLMWEIADDEVGAKRDEREAPKARRRLKAVASDAVASD